VQTQPKDTSSVRSMMFRIVLVIAVAALLLLSTNAVASPPKFGSFCQKGSGLGECLTPQGVATSPLTGHVFLADEGNQRVDEFSAWGEFIRSWGWGVRTGAAELQSCDKETACQKGLPGAGVGQFSGPVGLAVDSEGHVYVVDWENYRVQKFDSEGHFLLMFGGGVDQGPNHPGDLCTAAFVAEGDTCGTGTTGTGNGQFSSSWKGGDPLRTPFVGIGIAIDTANQVYVGDVNRIQVFDSSGIYQRQLGLPHPGAVGSLAEDPGTGDLYMAYPNIRLETVTPIPNVYRLDRNTGSQIGEPLKVNKPNALAVDESGKIYVFAQYDANAPEPGAKIQVFDGAGPQLETIPETEGPGSEEVLASSGIATGEACFSGNQEGIYVSEAEIFGPLPSALYAYGPTPDPALCSPPQIPPSLDAQFATSVAASTALVKAEINPHYFTEAVGITTYYVQYGPAGCVESEGWEAGCVSNAPVPPASLQATPTDADVTTAGVALSGLSSGATYRYRFVVEGSGAPGEPVVGVGGEPGVEGTSATFRTMPLPTSPPACSNDAFRVGAGSSLPDCRAYEMVSPLEKEGGDAVARLNIVPFEARMDQTSISGNALTFSAYRAFSQPKSAPFSSQYLSKRNPDLGWSTGFISPPQEGEAFINQLFQVDNLFRAFTEDLELSWLQTDTDPVLGAGGLAGHPNLYQRQSDGLYSACASAAPQLSEEGTHGPQLQGFATDGHLAVFRIENKLTSNASSSTRVDGRPIYQIYACSYEGGIATVRLVSALPNGSASTLENTVGGPANEIFQLNQGRTESLENAVSRDGTKVFWTANSGIDGQDLGALYVRLNPGAEPTGGTCVAAEPEKACTILISAGPARFWTAAEDGSLALFSTKSGQLNEYEVATKQTRPIANEVLGVLGASADAKRVYFVSKAALAPGATVGEPNLYLHDASSESDEIIGVLSEEDLSQADFAPGPVDPEPAFHVARVTPDGATAVFMSNDPQLSEKVAGYDNTDQQIGLPTAEIYRYSLGEGLTCISCNRTGVRPRGREVQNQHLQNSPTRLAASLLPPWLNSLYAPRVLSGNGKRVYFESFEPLVSADTNEKADVYQWEQSGTGSCNEAGSTFDPKSGGCVSLISSGTAPTDSQFVDASSDGHDVFIRTASSLVPWDPGQIDIYDAREGGGFPSPPTPPAECEGEACQSPPAAPSNTTPASSSYHGPGNLREGSKSKKCPKGRHRVRSKGKVRCAKNHKKHHQKKHSSKSGRAGR
jgi:sugar lactone lactonase YvrE